MMTLPEVVWQFWSWLEGLWLSAQRWGVQHQKTLMPLRDHKSHSLPFHPCWEGSRGENSPPTRKFLCHGGWKGQVCMYWGYSQCVHAGAAVRLRGTCSLQGSQSTWGLLSCNPMLFGFQGQEGLKQAGRKQFFLELLSSCGPFPWICVYC